MTNRSKLFIGLGILSAATAGVTIGLAFAPDKGEKTRTKLKRGLNDIASTLLDYLKSSRNNMVSRGEDAVDRVKARGEEAIDRAKAKGNELKGYAKAKIDEVEEEVK